MRIATAQVRIARLPIRIVTFQIRIAPWPVQIEGDPNADRPSRNPIVTIQVRIIKNSNNVEFV
jgi:hypothetical protein